MSRINFAMSCLTVIACLAVVSPSLAVTVQMNPSLNTQSFSSSTSLKTATSGTNAVVAIGIHNNGTSGPIRSFTAFDLSSLPVSPYLVINSATFSFNTQNNEGNIPNPLVMVELNTPLTMNTSVTWTSIDGTNNWTTPGGDIGNVLGTLSPTWANNTNYVFPSTSNFVQAAQDAYDAGGPLQTLLYMPQQEAAFPVPSTAGGFIRIHARNNPTLAGILTLDYDIVIPPAPIPEPSTAILAGMGFCALISVRRKKRQAQAGI